MAEWKLAKRDILDAIDFLFAERQGHCPHPMYEDGYSDACADAKSAIKRIYLLEEAKIP